MSNDVEEETQQGEREKQGAVNPQPPTEMTYRRMDRLSTKEKIVLMVAVLLAIVLLVTGICATGNCGRSSSLAEQAPRSRVPTFQPTFAPVTQAPTAAPTIAITPAAVQSFINSITLSGRTLQYPSNATAPERALQWLMDGGSVNNEERLRQRYALASFWFQTPEPFTTSFDETFWTTSTHECEEWLRVDCDEGGSVVSLDFVFYLDDDNQEQRYVGVEGQLSDDLGLLTALTSLTLPSGIPRDIASFLGVVPTFSGTLPSSFGLLTALEHLEMESTGLTGTIPSSWGSMTALTYLDLSNNYITGSIPSSLGLLTALTYLALSKNDLTGTLPSSLGSLTSLEYLRLFDNAITGTIPSWLGLLTALTYAGLSRNDITGTVPSSLGLLTALADLSMSSNDITGTIPSSLGSLTSLTRLFLTNTQLAGTIPSSFGSLTSLTQLRLYDNKLTGTMPMCTANQTFSNKMFDTLIVDCDEMDCPCCTECCPGGGRRISGGISFRCAP